MSRSLSKRVNNAARPPGGSITEIESPYGFKSAIVPFRSLTLNQSPERTPGCCETASPLLGIYHPSPHRTNMAQGLFKVGLVAGQKPTRTRHCQKYLRPRRPLLGRRIDHRHLISRWRINHVTQKIHICSVEKVVFATTPPGALRVVQWLARLIWKPARVNSSLIRCLIHSALCYI